MTHHVLLVEFQIHPVHTAAFDSAIRLNARTSLRDEAGCSVFDVCVDSNMPGRFVLYEVYDSAQAIAHHLQTPHFLAFDAQCAPWVQHKSVQRLTLENH